jgi:hypothetical protein
VILENQRGLVLQYFQLLPELLGVLVDLQGLVVQWLLPYLVHLQDQRVLGFPTVQLDQVNPYLLELLVLLARQEDRLVQGLQMVL